MPSVLIVAGNKFEATFLGACFAAKTVLGSIDSVFIFDTAESAQIAETSQRASKIRNLLGPVDITSSIFDDTTIQIHIPDKVAKLIRQHGHDQIIVDLSNGQKLTASVLYAVSTISRISHIYVLEIYKRLEENERIWDLEHHQNWDYIKIHPLRDILNITQSSYVELIYYRDRIESVVSAIASKNESFANNIQDRLEHSLIDYFAVTATEDINKERLERCVNGLGKITEDIAQVWYAFCQKNSLISGKAKDFNGKVKQIVSQWDQYRSQAAKGEMLLTDVVEKAVLPTFANDAMLEMMRIYRNFASHHKRDFLFRQGDARLAMDMTLLILERLADSNILQVSNTESELELDNDN